VAARVIQFVAKWRVAIGVLLVASLALGGCTAQRKYRVLNFFFDGVPDPNAPVVDPRQYQLQRGTAASPVFVHKPYAENNCGGCHLNTDNLLARAKVPADVCQKCHAAVATAFPVMHGPVAVGACQKCHSPHQSRNKHLLREASPKVCVQCHTPALLGSMPPEHMDPKADCLTCHNAHGGNHRGLLKEIAFSTTRPTDSKAVPE
jgi:predicted CXXCH cytochrome family protein